MKKIILVFAFVAFTLHINAQNTFELGIRLGYVASVDMALLVKSNRIHSNIGWGIDYYLFDNCYDFRIPIINEKWIIYSGPGLGLRYWDKTRSEHEGIGFAVLGEIGLEHRFNSPVTLGLDWTPFFDVVKSEYNNYGTICLRYRF